MTAWMLAVILKATLLLVGLAVIAQLARRTPAATRHFVWTSGLAVLLLLPALALVLPGWAPQWAGDWTPDLLVPQRVSAEETPISLWLVPSERQRGGLSPVTEDAVAMGTRAADSAREIAEEYAQSPAAESVVATSISGAVTTGHRVARVVAPWLLATWIVGALVMASWLAVGLVRRARLARGARPLDDGALVDAGNEVARALDLRRRVKLLLGDAPFVPMTWGVVRPVLYLPAAAHGWSPRRLRTVLMHELAHIKRNDSLSRLLAQMACSVFWFHPLAWAAAGRMLREQERACDDVVIVAGADPHEYADTLVQMAREFRAPRPCVVGALAFSRRSNLEHRLLSILDPLERRKNMSTFRKAFVAVLFIAAVLPLAAFRPTAAQEPDGAQRPGVKPRVVVEPVEVPVPQLVAEPVEVPVPQLIAEPVELPVPQLVAEPVEVPLPQIVAEPVQEAATHQVLQIVEEGGQIRLEAKGLAHLPSDVDAVELEPGGSLIVTQGDRRLEVVPATDGGLSFRYTVDGAEQPFDDEARGWVNGILERNDEIGDLHGNMSLTVGDGRRVLRIDPGSLELSMEPLELPQLEMHLAMEQLEAALEPLEELSLTLEAPSHDLEITLEGLEAELEPLQLTLADLAPNLEPIELSLSHIGTELESLELTLDGLRGLDVPPLGMGRFDSVQIWRDDESRVAVMQVGEVEIGATVDDITVGEDGDLVIDERGPDGRRRLHVYAGADGNPVFEWYVDGEETPFDDAGRAWLRPILERIR
jgi:beta-lactamase regulating signal transducer with metallopeptidase domain